MDEPSAVQIPGSNYTWERNRIVMGAGGCIRTHFEALASALKR